MWPSILPPRRSDSPFLRRLFRSLVAVASTALRPASSLRAPAAFRVRPFVFRPSTSTDEVSPSGGKPMSIMRCSRRDLRFIALVLLLCLLGTPIAGAQPQPPPIAGTQPPPPPGPPPPGSPPLAPSQALTPDQLD